MMIFNAYKGFMNLSAAPLMQLLKLRLKRGKEDPDRWLEKTGKPGIERPEGKLIWIHAASVGESVSALILITHILQKYPKIFILVTTGTRTSAKMMETRLPERAFHQYAPLDHPAWIEQFFNYWRPDFAIWMESELWPNSLHALKKYKIPSVLINARLSERSARMWRLIKKDAQDLLSVFSLCLTQTDQDAANFKSLGIANTTAIGNLKYSSEPLPCDHKELAFLKSELAQRPIWLYASSHANEEVLAVRIHERLKQTHANLLTIIVPRHPERGGEIASLMRDAGLNMLQRGAAHTPPNLETEIYIADTLGELGLFYRLSPIAMIGRSFSSDGGGGHNPIEAAQLDCAVIYGPNVQNLQDIYDQMAHHQAAQQVYNRTDFFEILQKLLKDPDYLEKYQKRAKDFANSNRDIIYMIMKKLSPLLDDALLEDTVS